MKTTQNKAQLLIICLLLVCMWFMNARIGMLHDNVESLRNTVYQMLLASPPNKSRPFYPPDKKKRIET
jgi:hypothetical protein